MRKGGLLTPFLHLGEAKELWASRGIAHGIIHGHSNDAHALLGGLSRDTPNPPVRDSLHLILHKEAIWVLIWSVN